MTTRCGCSSPAVACRPGASKILRRLARAERPTPESELHGLFVKESAGQTEYRFEELMTCLEEDYDLVKENGGWSFRSKTLKERWRLSEPWLTEGD